MAWALDITEKVNQVTDLTVSLWTPAFSPGVGTLTWVTACEDLEQLEVTDTKLMTDPGFQLLLDEGARFQSAEGLNDTLEQYVTPAPPQSPDAPQPHYATVVNATVAPGNFGRGMALGVTIAEQATRITGRDTAFLAGVTGHYGQVSWVALYENVNQVQAAQQAIAADPAFSELIDKEASTAYQAAAEQLCFRRIV